MGDQEREKHRMQGYRYNNNTREGTQRNQTNTRTQPARQESQKETNS